MEPFLDGGLLEILVALGFAAIVNFIFLRRYLLVFFSLLIIAGPIILLFFKENELFYWVVAISLLNNILLTVLLWKRRKERPAEPLFNVDSMRKKLSDMKHRISSAFARKLPTKE